MKHQLLAIDADDVLLDFGGRVIETVNMEYDANLKLEDVTSWNLSELLDPILGEDWWEWWEERDWLWAKAPAIRGAMGALRILRREGHSIHIVTAKPDWARAGLMEWLGKWKPYFDHLSIGPARPPMHKPDYTQATLLVDDKPENCMEFKAAGREAILFDRPHNQSFPNGRNDLIRAKGWRDTLNVIRRLRSE